MEFANVCAYVCLVIDLQFILTSFAIPNPLKVKKILWLDVQMNLLTFVHFSWVCKWKIETIAKFVAPQWKLNEKKPYWVWFDAKVRPIGTKRYMWGFALWVYYHGQNLSIIKVDEHPLIVVVAIWMTRSQVTGWNQLEGFTKSSCGSWDLVARSRLPTLERGRGSNWEPRD